ncbi:hypothetical protein GCM10023318_06010 [Nocardia callitridis]|uniref:Uncharacterized protein n=1 Tax=Nocardia callitridis TaxID=648753 RepID=A0ABP9JUY4_9NOCA
MVFAQCAQAVGVGDGGVIGVFDVAGLHREAVEDHRGQVFGHRHLDGRIEDHAGRLGVLEHERDPLGRVGRVDRHITGAGLHDRDQRDDQVQRTRQDHRDQGFRSRAIGDQPARQHIRAPIQFRVGQCLHTEARRGAVGVRGDHLVEQPDEGDLGVGESTRRGVGAGADPALRHVEAFALAEQVDIADGDGGFLGDRAQDPHQPVGEGRDRRRIEQFRCVVPCQRQAAVGRFAHGQLHIEFRCARVEFEHIHIEAGQLDGADIGR